MKSPNIEQVISGLFGLTLYVVTYSLGLFAMVTVVAILLPGFHPHLSEWAAIKLTPWAVAIAVLLTLLGRWLAKGLLTGRLLAILFALGVDLLLGSLIVLGEKGPLDGTAIIYLTTHAIFWVGLALTLVQSRRRVYR